MHLPTHLAPNARRAADLAVPGTWASCAVNPRAPLFTDAPYFGEDGRGGSSLGTGRIGWIRRIGQDQKDQRGRAVACA